MRCELLISVLLCFLLLPAPSHAQNRSVSMGLFNSPRGFGAAASFNSEDGRSFSELSLFADIYGLPTGRCGEPGVKASFVRNFIFSSFEIDDVRLGIFAGPGVSAGFVKDYEPGYALDITRNHGLCAALCGDIGLRVRFSRGVSLGLSFQAELGFHMRRDDDMRANNLAIYKNGLVQSFWPNLSILFDL